MSGGAWRYAALERNTKAIKEFCKKYRFDLRELTPYQFRIEEVMDVYPVRQKWHWIETDDRGVWSDLDELKRIFLEHLPEVEQDKPEPPERTIMPLKASEQPMQIKIHGKVYNLVEVKE